MRVLVKPLYQDPFSPILFSSPGLAVTTEQKMYIKEILDIACSDNQFSNKAYRAIEQILVGGSFRPPVVAMLTPASAEIGDPSFTLHVHGTGFTSGSKIIFNGFEEPTTFVSATELTTGVDMSVWLGPAVLPVTVLAENGVISNPQSFTFTDGVPALAFTAKEPTKTVTATKSVEVKK